MAAYETADEIRAARAAHGWSVAQAVRELRRMSDTPLAEPASLERTWKRWEAGTRPNHTSRALLMRLFDGVGPGARSPGRPARPTVWRRWLAFELRRLREEAGLTVREAAHACRWTASRLGYIENVQLAPLADDVEKLLSLYGVPASRWGRFLSAAAEEGRGWRERSDERELPEWLALYVGLERGATSLRSFEATVVPGLLQTADYARAVLRGDFLPRSSQQVERLVEGRLARQAVLTRPDPLDLWAIVDEAALRRAPSRPVMAAQLAHLADIAELPNVTVQVLPFSAGVHSYSFGAFLLLGFPWPSDPGAVYLEHRHGALFLEEPHEVAAHALVFDQLGVWALSPDASLALIRTMAREYDHG